MNKEVNVFYSNGLLKYQTMPRFQYDHGLVLRIHGQPDTTGTIEAQFTNVKLSTTLNVPGNMIDDYAEFDIPASIMMFSRNALAYVYFTNSTQGRTVLEVEIPIIPRPKPSEFNYTPEQIQGYQQLLAQLNEEIDEVEELNKLTSSAASNANTAANTAKLAATNANNAISGLDEKIDTGVEKRIAQITDGISGNEYAAELISARTDEDGQVHESLKKRLDHSIDELHDVKAASIPDTSDTATVHEIMAQEGSCIEATIHGFTYQEGEGDPSPENVRPIHGMDAAWARAGSKNLLDISRVTVHSGVHHGLSIEKNNDEIIIKGTANSTDENKSFAIVYVDSQQKAELSGKGYVITPFLISGAPVKLYGLRTSDETAIAAMTSLTEGVSFESRFKVMVSDGAPTAYEPYCANAADLPLLPDNAPLMEGDTIENWAKSGCDVFAEYDGSSDEKWTRNVTGGGEYYYINLPDADPLHRDKMYCNLFPRKNSAAGVYWGVSNNLVLWPPEPIPEYSEFREWLASNKPQIRYRSTDYTPDKDLRVCRVERKWNAISLDGTQTPYTETAWADGAWVFYHATPDYDIARSKFYCSALRSGISANRISQGESGLSFVGNSIILCVDSQYNTADKIKQYLTENPISVVYGCNEKVYYTDPLRLEAKGLLPDIVTGSGNTTLVYQHDTKDYMDRISDRTSALETAVTKALPTDKTLSFADKAADAKVVGDRFAENEADIEKLYQTKANIIPDESALAASHELHAQRDYPLNVAVHGYTYQEGEGDPSPENVRPIHGLNVVRVHCGGKNLIDISGFVKHTISGITYTPTGDGGVSINGTLTAEVGQSYSYPIAIPCPGNYYFSCLNAMAGCGFYLRAKMPDGSLKYMVNNSFVQFDGTETELIIYINITAKDALNLVLKPMLNAGATALSYEPYCANDITPDLLPLDETGKGAPLMDGDTVENWALSGCDKKIVLDGTQEIYGFYTNYVAFSITDLDDVYPVFADYLDSGIEGITTIPASYPKCVCLRRTGGSVFDEMDRNGVLSYLAANPLTVYYRSTDYTPDKDLKVCRVERNKKLVEYDGSADEEWEFGYYGHGEVSVPARGLLSNNQIKSETLKLIGGGEEKTGFFTTNGRIAIKSTSCTTLAEYKELIEGWASEGKPATFLYPLATPEVYYTDPLPLLPPAALESETVTVTGSSETEVEYAHEPYHIIKLLSERIAALEASATSVPTT